MSTDQAGPKAKFPLKVTTAGVYLLIMSFLAWVAAEQIVESWSALSGFGVVEIIVFIWWALVFLFCAVVASTLARLFWVRRELLCIDESGILFNIRVGLSPAKWTWDEIRAVELGYSGMGCVLRIYWAQPAGVGDGSDRQWSVVRGEPKLVESAGFNEIILGFIAAPREEILKAVQDGLEASRLRRCCRLPRPA